METSELTSAEFWEGEEIDIRLNPKLPFDTKGLADFVRKEMGIASAVILATSGSEGQPKFVVLKKSALLSSARAVNEHCALKITDTWLGGLSTFHVGGLGIFARAHLSGADVIPMPWNEWQPDGKRFVEMCFANWIRVTSLTPVHLFDLVSHRVRCPESLRGVFIGGGTLNPQVALRAIALGWPIWTTYGMTETCSQIATSSSEEFDWLPVLPQWEVRAEQDGRLAVRGDALFSGYVVRESDGAWKAERPFDSDGWFTTGDICRIKGDVLKFSGRADDLVKVSGELISVGGLELRLAAELEPLGSRAVVIARPHPRRENELVAYVESGDEVQSKARKFSEGLPALQQFAEIIAIEKLPRTGVGKIDRAKLRGG